MIMSLLETDYKKIYLKKTVQSTNKSNLTFMYLKKKVEVGETRLSVTLFFYQKEKFFN
jgi:hypothetical protein